MDLFRRNEPVLMNRDVFDRPAPIPQHRIRDLTPDLTIIHKRQSDSDGSSGSSSSRHSSSTPIIIGVVVPVVIIFIILFVIWKRRQKITRHEEANDKYKSLDFGIDETGFVKKKGRKGAKMPEMTVAELKGSLRRDKGLSLDLTSTSPYILPPEVHQSRESLHSLSRNLNTGDDKYQRTTFIPDDGSIRSPSSLRSHGETSSIFSASTRHRAGTMETESRSELLPRQARDVPTIKMPMASHEKPRSGLLAPGMSDMDRNSTLSTNSNTAAFRASNNYLGQFIKGGNSKRTSIAKKDDQPGLIISEIEVSSTPPAQEPTELPAAVLRDEPRSVKRSSSHYENNQMTFELPDTNYENNNYYQPTQQPALPQMETKSYEIDDSSRFSYPKRTKSLRKSGEYNQAVHQANGNQPPVPERPRSVSRSRDSKRRSQQTNANHPPISGRSRSASRSRDSRRMSGQAYASQPPVPGRSRSGSRSREQNRMSHQANANYPPVPEISVQHTEAQHDVPDDGSDYYDEELYDDYMAYSRMSMMGTRPLPPDDPNENPEQRASRIRSFYKEYFDDSKGGQRQNNVYYDGSEQFDNYEAYDDFDYGYYEQAHSRGPSLHSDGRYRSRAFSQGSRGYANHPPRAYSTMSGRIGHGPRMPPKKKLPPPKALMVLPTPHKLKDDDFLPNAIDFAPPQVFKNQRSGTPDSLRGGMRPYSPSIRPHIPLASSFDDLAVVPSPHALRKSGTFTGLDFAPPRRFKEGSQAGSDAGSIRSYRSNVSQMQLHNIRNGAYRVSRIPKEVAGTRDDMFTALKPKWDMRGDGVGTPTLR